MIGVVVVVVLTFSGETGTQTQSLSQGEMSPNMMQTRSAMTTPGTSAREVVVVVVKTCMQHRLRSSSVQPVFLPHRTVAGWGTRDEWAPLHWKGVHGNTPLTQAQLAMGG